MAIFEGVDGKTPPAALAASYHKAIGSPSFAVLSDVSDLSLGITPYEGTALPGKCALTPQMEILGCATGHGSHDLFQLIEQHAAAK